MSTEAADGEDAGNGCLLPTSSLADGKVEDGGSEVDGEAEDCGGRGRLRIPHLHRRHLSIPQSPPPQPLHPTLPSRPLHPTLPLPLPLPRCPATAAALAPPRLTHPALPRAAMLAEREGERGEEKRETRQERGRERGRGDRVYMTGGPTMF